VSVGGEKLTARCTRVEVITSMAGLGGILGAELLAAPGGDMAVIGALGRLAGFGDSVW
jgi:hypothetical protein